MIKDLRKLDPAWQVEQIGFGYWRYSHFDKGLATQSYSQIVDAELDLYSSNWYLFQDNKLIRCGTKQYILHFLEKNFDTL
jgi:hypothetical protein